MDGERYRPPLIGSRYRYDVKNVFTGVKTATKEATCIQVDPPRSREVQFPPRCTLQREDGTTFHPFICDFWDRYQAVGNVVPFSKGRNDA